MSHTRGSCEIWDTLEIEKHFISLKDGTKKESYRSSVLLAIIGE
jgi:hypothetical protein